MSDHSEQVETESAPNADVVATLVANHRAFLAFVERRVANREIAEEILRNAFVKSVSKFDAVRETAIGWFYRVLRNAIIDHHRRKAAADRRLESYATEAAAAEDHDEELHRTVCVSALPSWRAR